jgi:aminoglycoside 3-N-acetyltransferase
MGKKSNINREQIEAGLRQAGLGDGDVVLLHGSVWSLGHVEGGPPQVVQAFLNVLGEAGTLVVPTFGDLGVLTQIVHDDPRAVHSIAPPASVAAIGPHAEVICRDHWQAATAHGHNTPYTRIADLGGYVCLLGVDHDRNTTLHTVEALLELPYLKNEPFEIELPGDGVQKGAFKHFPGPHRDFIGLDRRLHDAGIVTVTHIGSAEMRLMKSRALIDYCMDLGRRDPAFVLCDNPACEDCTTQRTALGSRDRFANEPFVVAAASSLTGSKVAQIIDNLRAAEITHIELDDPAISIDELTDAGITVTGLRYGAPPNTTQRIVAPLTDTPGAGTGALSFFNVDQSSEQVRQLLEQRDQKRFTFSPCGFARIGEKPFSQSLNRSKARRTIDQLDVEDCLFDGTPKPLGRGNTEIKELISILRCGGFNGFLVLSANNRQVGTLTDAVNQLQHLLDTI